MDLRRLTSRLARTITQAATSHGGRRGPARRRPPPGPSVEPAVEPTRAQPLSRIPLGKIEYAPRKDGDADPGEVVWAWVPYEDDPRRGKDRPVLVVGRSGHRLVGLMLSSQDHDRDARDEAHYGRHWMDVGTGDWDARRRPSEVRLDRVLSLPPRDVRREGAALPEAVFSRVVAALTELHQRQAG